MNGPNDSIDDVDGGGGGNSWRRPDAGLEFKHERVEWIDEEDLRWG